MKRRRKVQSVSLACVQALRSVQTTTLTRDSAPTPERLAKAGAIVALEMGTRRVQIIGKGASDFVGYDGIVRLKQAPLDRLHNRDRLDADPERNRQLYEAGEKLRDHHFISGLSGFAANDVLGSAGGGHPANRLPITETMESSRRALRLAESATDADAWRVLRAVVCEEDTLEATGQALGFLHVNAANAVALDRLRRGLGDLAVLWGFSPPQRPQRATPLAANDPAPAAAAVA